MTDQNDALQHYLDRVTPIFREMFGIAHAITDQYETAEYVVQKAIQRGFADRGKRRSNKMSFNERMKYWVVRYAAEQVKQNGHPADGEGTWTGFDDVDVMDNAFLEEAVREPLLMRRILMMKFGAGLHSHEIAPIVGMDKKRVRSYLQQFEARVMHRLRGKAASYEKLARRAAQKELTRVDADIPDTAATFRQLQSDLVDSVHTASRGNPVSRAIGVLFLVIGVVLCVLLFWLFAVMLDSGEGLSSGTAAPVAVEEPAADAGKQEMNRAAHRALPVSGGQTAAYVPATGAAGCRAGFDVCKGTLSPGTVPTASHSAQRRIECVQSKKALRRGADAVGPGAIA